MVVTKQELKDHISKITGKNKLINYDYVFNSIINSLEWNDEEPRDIRISDIDLLEDVVASEIDTFLNSMAELAK